jgi:GTP-binding protein EngB required for normal cell division
MDPSAPSETRRAQLLRDLDAAAAVPDVDATTLVRLRAKLAANTFNLVVAGEFKRGKSSVINALLGAEVLPTAVVPLTSVVTVLQHAETPSATVTYADGRREAILLGTLADYVTERENPRNRKHVQEVEVAYPAEWLGQGIRLVDTPGIGSAYQHNTDVAVGYLPQADAVIFVASVDQPVSRAELQFLADIRSQADRVFCLLNKIDHLSEAELAESVAFSTSVLRTELGDSVRVFPVSARVAIKLAADNDPHGFARSGFAEFDAALRHFLARDSDEVLLNSVRRHLSRLLAASRLAVELELKALTAPLQSLDASLRAFMARKAEIMQQRLDFAALLEADSRRLVKDTIEPRIVEFKTDLVQCLDARAAEWVQRALQQRDVAPQVELERQVVADVRRAFDTFRRDQDNDAATKFDEVCARFRQRVDRSVDELMTCSAELFQVHFDAIPVEPLREARSRFYYKFWEEPASLGLLADALTGWLPRRVQRPILRRRARQRIAELVEMQAGRLRHDLDDRVARATQTECRQVRKRIDTTIASIESAITKGRDLQIRDATAADTRRLQLGVVLEQIDELASA